MGILAKTVNGKLQIATFRVATPTYTLYVANYSVDGPVQDDWVYYNDPETPKNVAASITLTATVAIKQRILTAFKAKFGQDKTAVDIELWMLGKLRAMVREYELGESE